MILFYSHCFEGKLSPILKVPCSNKFLFWHYCLFFTRTQILSIIWSTENIFVFPWPLALALSLMIKQKSIENDTNLLVWVGHQGERPKLENLNFFSISDVFVGTRIKEYTFYTETTIVLWRNTFSFYFSPQKKKDNPGTVGSGH